MTGTLNFSLARQAGSGLLESNPPVGGTLIGKADFTDGNLVPASIYPNTYWLSGAFSGGSIAIVGGAFRATIPIATGNTYAFLAFYFPPNTSDVYVKFRARMSNGQWLKFVKFFGINLSDGTGYANTTYGLLAGGVLPTISFGDGSGLNNDVANAINLNGANPEYAGRSYPTPAIISTPQNSSFNGMADGNYHTFKIHQKYDTGTSSANEVADGISYLEIDGLVYSNSRNLFNRNPVNKSLDRVSFIDYAQDGTAGFTIDFDDIEISTGGFYS